MKKDEGMEKNEESVNGDGDLGADCTNLTTIGNGYVGEIVPGTIYCGVDADIKADTVELKIENGEDKKKINSESSDEEEDKGGCKVVYNNGAKLKMKKRKRATKKRRASQKQSVDFSDKDEDDVQCETDSNTNADTTEKGKKYGKKQIMGSSREGDDKELTSSIKPEDDLQCGDSDANTNAAITKKKKRKRVLTGSNSYDEEDGGKVNIKTPDDQCKRRGRSKKMAESYVCKGDVSAESTKGVVTRVLRSNTKVTNDHSADISKQKKKNVASLKKKIEERRGRPRKSLTTDSDVSNFSVGVKRSKEIIPNKKLKSSRGRPCKLQEESGHPKSTASFEAPKPQKGRGRPSKVSTVLKTKKDVRTNKNVEKCCESRHSMAFCSDNEVTDSNISGDIALSVDVSKSTVCPNGTSTLACHSQSSSERVVVEGTQEDKDQDTTGKNQIRRSIQKNLLREQIVCMLKDAGWTFEYRPRNGRAYNDTVYVSPEGKSHWSITLAYRVLKQKLEAGDADSATISAFSAIPEEEFTKLLRITTPGIKKGKIKRKKEVSEPSVYVGSKKKKKLSEEKRVNSSHGRKRKLDSAGKQSSKSHKQVKRGCTLLVRDSECDVDPDKEGYVFYERKKGEIRRKKKVESEASVYVGSKKKKKLSEEKKVNSSHGRKRKLDSTRKQSSKPHKQVKRRCTLLVRDSECDVDPDNEGYVLYEGKRSLLSWMIDLGTILLGGKVHCTKQRRSRSLTGRITNDGIHCDCCNKILSVSEFVSHAGNTTSQPLQAICLESGISLMQCLLDSWNKYKESECFALHSVDLNDDDPNDDTCNKCGDGGNLICCDGCPSTFHQSCLNIKKFPSGDWHCAYCTCKYCACIAESARQKDEKCPVEHLELLNCCLCEQKYHKLCAPEYVASDADSSFQSFCGKKCQQIFDKLQLHLGVKYQLDEGFSWSLVRLSGETLDETIGSNPTKVQCYSRLAVSYTILDECFKPILDQRSGINMIRNVVYSCGSNIKRLNFTGFLTAILEKGDELISAATIRIHGNQLAEMPFIGTRHIHRRQGMCRRLLKAIESALCSLNVERLVIPAIPELQQTWTCVFGFKPLEESSKKEMEHMNLITFPGVDMLQKTIPEHGMESALENEFNAHSKEDPAVVIPTCNSTAILDLPEQERNEVEKSDKHLEQSKSREMLDSLIDPLHSNPCPNRGLSVSASVVTDDKVPIPAQQHENDILIGVQENAARVDDPETSCVSSHEQPLLTHLCNSSAVNTSSNQLLNTTKLC